MTKLRVIRHEELPEGQFGGEWQNTFWVACGLERRLRCRKHHDEGETYISWTDWNRELSDQDRAFLKRAGVPQRFYEDRPECRTTLVRSTAQPRATAPAPQVKPPVPKREEPMSGEVECSFAWGSELGDFIVLEMEGHPDYRVELTGRDTIAVFRRSDGKQLGSAEVMKFRTKLGAKQAKSAA